MITTYLRQCPTLLLLLALLASPAIGDENAAAPATEILAMETLAEGVFAFRPTDTALASWQAVSNSGAVVLEDGVLIYDSHWSPRHLAAARRLLRAKTDKPIRYVVLSHRHGDHTGGTWALESEVELISHHATHDLLREDYAKLPKELPAQVAGMEQQLEGATDPAQRNRVSNALLVSRDLLERVERGDPAPLPSLTFEKGITLHRGRGVEIYFLGRGHTAGDSILYLPDEKIAFLGDLLFERTLPNVTDGFTAEWIATLEKILQLDATRFVPGHGAVADADAVRQQIAYLKWLRGAVAPFVDQEGGLEKALAGISLPEQYADYEFSFFLPANVRKVYTELSGGN